MRVILFFFHSFRLLFAIFFIANTMDLVFYNNLLFKDHCSHCREIKIVQVIAIIFIGFQ